MCFVQEEIIGLQPYQDFLKFMYIWCGLPDVALYVYQQTVSLTELAEIRFHLRPQI